MKKLNKDTLKKIFLFSSLDDGCLLDILKSTRFDIRHFKSGDVIFDSEHNERALCFVLSGRCEVERERATDTIPVKAVKPYEAFGIISVFSSNEKYPTKVKSSSQSEVLFIDKETIDRLMRDYPLVSESLIRFLCQRVEYLNDQLSTLSAKSLEGRLAKKLLSMCEASGDSISISMTRLSGEIAIGRASLYRILDEFEKKGLVKTDKKSITVLNYNELEKIQ